MGLLGADRAVRVREVRPRGVAPALFGDSSARPVGEVPGELLDVVEASESNLGDGVARTWEVGSAATPMQVAAFFLDVPPDVDAEVYIDGRLRLQVADRRGCVGVLPFRGLMRTVRVVGSNQAGDGSTRDVRAWLEIDHPSEAPA